MKKLSFRSRRRHYRQLPALLIACGILLSACQDKIEEPETVAPQITQLEPADAARLATEIEGQVSTQVAEGLKLSLWASDQLAPDPIALSIDRQGRAYITRTNRQKNSEFDIRGHRDWMTASITLQTVEDRRAFLRETFAPERSEENSWLPDLNEDGSHDWHDLAVEKEQVFRIEDRDGDGIAEYAQLFVEDFHEEVTDVAGAVLPFGDDVFLGVAPDLWRLQDRNGDGMVDFKESISHGYQVHIGFGGHGMSGLTYGPDGKIYWGIGDIGMNVTAPDGTQWSYPNQGVIVRANPDGSDFEVFCHGVRNTHEFVFDEYGNLISVDNDGDHPGEKERVVYLVNGADSGWRINWQFGKYTDPDNNTYKVWMDEEMYKPRFEGQAAYFTPPIVNYHAGPAGMVYNPGTALGEKWRNRFFIAEFTGSPARSNIYAFQLEPKGAGFEFKGEETVLNGILVTGLDFGPDGALYAADWLDGWGTKNTGRIWKLDDPSEAGSALRAKTKELLAGNLEEKPDNELAELLKYPDMRVRLYAQFALAKRGKKGEKIFLAAIRQKEHQLARIHGIWGIAQLARQEMKYAEALPPLLTDSDPEIRAQAAKLIGDIRYKAPADQLIPLLQDDSDRVRFFAAEALGRIAYAPAIDPIIKMLQENNDVDLYLRHAGSLALARIGQVAPVEALADHPSRALRIAAVVALRRMKAPGIARFLQDKDEYIVTEAARAVNDDYSIEAALPALARVLKETRFTNEALIRRTINANLRVGTDENLQILANYASRAGAPEAMRAEAVSTLGVWAKPSVLDRVDGRYRGPIERDAATVRAVVSPLIAQWLTADSGPVVAAAAIAAGKLKVEEAVPTLLTLVRSGRTPEVRSAALEALAGLKDARIGEAIQIALKDKENSVRSSALALLPGQDIDQEQKIQLFSQALETASIREQQTVVRALGEMPAAQSEPLLKKLLAQLTAGALSPGIELELTETIEAGKSEALKSELTAYLESKPDDPVAQYSAALMGGNRRNGWRIFNSHETAQCVRCHSLEPSEDGVGPSLAGVGARLSREEILESLVAPSARIAPGFGIVTLTLNDDEKVTGILRKETGTQLILKIGEEGERTIAKSAVKERQDAPSSMLPVALMLEKSELRDVVEFLTELK